MNKVILTGLLAFSIVLPSMAANITTRPTDGYVKNQDNNSGSNTYVGMADSGLLDGATSGTVTANPWYTLDAGYYLERGRYDASPCLAGKYCAGDSNTAITYNANDAQGITGDIAAGYYASKGAKKANPTSNSDCVDSGTCGQCLSGFTTTAGYRTSVTQCHKTVSTGTSCSSVFPVTLDTQYGIIDTGYRGPVSGVVYGSNVQFNATNNPTTFLTGNETTSALNCLIRQTSSSAQGSCVVSEPTNCLVRGVTCDTEIGLSPKTAPLTTEQETFFPSATTTFSAGSANNYFASADIADTWGTFDIPFGNSAEVKGVWMKANNVGTDPYTYNGSVALAHNTSSAQASCYCQIQTVKAAGSAYWQPVISAWVNAPYENAANNCGRACVFKIGQNITSSSAVPLYYAYCDKAKYTVFLHPNGATGGKIANKSATTYPTGVVVSCLATNPIGSGYAPSGTEEALSRVCPWAVNDGSKYTSITKSDKIFVGWGDSANSTVPTTDTCAEDNKKTYYAVWATPSCAKGTGVSNAGTASVTQNQTQCTGVKCNANYYGASTQTGDISVATLTTSCSACPSPWTSAAGAATAITGCTRSITLDPNGATGGSAYSGLATSKTCNYNTNCTLPDVADKLTKPGYKATGWGTAANCTATTNTIKTTSTAATLKYYVCWTGNDITIKWTGVQTAGTGFTAVSNESNAYTSTVSYGGDIVTPTAAVFATPGQTFLGWKFVKAN